MKKDTKELFGVKEIARRANVSTGTVDRVIHNRPGVSEKTKNKISEIIRELDYQPNILASRLGSKKIFRIAILIPQVSTETNFWEAPLKGIKRAGAEIKRFGVNVDLFFFDLKDSSSFTRQSKLALKKKPNGILLSPSFTQEALDFTNLCKKNDLPVVLIDANLPGQEDISYIGPDLYCSGYQAAQLVDLGMKKKGDILILKIAEAQNDEQIVQGFLGYFKDNKKSPQVTVVKLKHNGKSSTEKSLEVAFTENKDVQAIFVTNSRVSSVATYLEKAGIKNVMLVGYDILKENVKYLEKGTIDFLICHKPEEQGYRAIMSLYQSLVLGTPIENLILMPIDIITRNNYKFYSN